MEKNEVFELFMKLGYERINDGKHIIYENCNNYISFCLDRKVVHLSNLLDHFVDLKMETFKAIEEQCKELGWYYDN